MSVGHTFSSGTRPSAGGFSLTRTTDPTILATLQTPMAQAQAANSTNATSGLPGGGEVQVPDWLSGGMDKNISELLQTYGNVPKAFDPTAQVKARNDAIGYNTSAGGQAANNAATEYANRASQTGGSALGAGVVKAQALMPVFAQNASLKSQAADVAAKSHQDAAGLAAQIASTIGSLRDSYLKTLTGYTQGQQGLALDRYKAEQDVASSAAQRELGYAGLRADQYKTDLQMKQQAADERRLAASTVLGTQAPSAQYETDNLGRVTSGMEDYTRLMNYRGAKDSALSALAGMF